MSSLTHTHAVAWKKGAVIGLLSLTVFVGSTQQLFAAENFFQRASRSVTTTFEGFYLKLPGSKPGKLVLKQMNEALPKLKSYESETTVDVRMQGADAQVGTAQLKVVGPTMMQEVWNPLTYKQQFALTGSVSFEGVALSMAAQLRMIDGVTYMNISQLPAIPGMSIDQLKNQWISFEPTADAAKEKIVAAQPTAEQQEQLRAAFVRMIESSQVSEAKPEKKDGVDTYMLTVTVPKAALAEYVKTITTLQTEQMKKSGELTAEMPDAEEMNASLLTALDAVGEIKVSLWVDRARYFPKHVELPLTIDAAAATAASGAAGAGSPVAGMAQKLTVKIASSMSKYNESFSIEKPTDAKSMESIMMGMMGPGVLPMSAPSAKKMPTIGTSELPSLSADQQKQLDDLEKQLQELEKMQY